MKNILFVTVLSALISTFTYANTNQLSQCKGVNAINPAGRLLSGNPVPKCINKVCYNNDIADVISWLNKSTDQISHIYRKLRRISGRSANDYCENINSILDVFNKIETNINVNNLKEGPEVIEFITAKDNFNRKKDELFMISYMTPKQLSNYSLLKKRKKEEASSAAREAWFKAEKEKKALIAEKRIKEIEIKKAKEVEKQHFEQQLASRMYSKNSTLVHLSSTKKGRSHYITNFKEQVLFAASNWHKNISLNEVDEFIISPKNEFEKSIDYQERKEIEKEKYNKSIIKQKKAFTEKKYPLLTQTLIEAVGKIKLTSLTYDADKELFSIIISAQNGDFITDATLNISIDFAEQVKTRLQASKIITLFKVVDDESIVLNKLLFISRQDLKPTESKIYEPIINQQSFSIKESDAVLWNIKYQELLAEKRKGQLEEQKIRQEQQLIAQKERAKKYPYEATFSCNLGRLLICLGKNGTINYLVDNQTKELGAYDLSSMHELTIPLSKVFSIIAQNGSSRGRTLSLEVKDMISGKIFYSEQTSTPSGLIKVKN